MGNTNTVFIEGDLNEEVLGDVSDPIKNLKIIRYLDLLTLMVFAILLTVYKIKSKKLAKFIEKDSITTADYAIKVTGFPKTGIPVDDLKQFFKQYGKVIEVNFIRNFGSTLFAFKNVAKFLDKEKREKFLMIKDPGRSPKKLVKF